MTDKLAMMGEPKCRGKSCLEVRLSPTAAGASAAARSPAEATEAARIT